jgi:hypothetical protein
MYEEFDGRTQTKTMRDADGIARPTLIVMSPPRQRRRSWRPTII